MTQKRQKMQVGRKCGVCVLGNLLVFLTSAPAAVISADTFTLTDALTPSLQLSEDGMQRSFIAEAARVSLAAMNVREAVLRLTPDTDTEELWLLRSSGEILARAAAQGHLPVFMQLDSVDAKAAGERLLGSIVLSRARASSAVYVVVAVDEATVRVLSLSAFLDAHFAAHADWRTIIDPERSYICNESREMFTQRYAAVQIGFPVSYATVEATRVRGRTDLVQSLQAVERSLKPGAADARRLLESFAQLFSALRLWQGQYCLRRQDKPITLANSAPELVGKLVYVTDKSYPAAEGYYVIARYKNNGYGGGSLGLVRVTSPRITAAAGRVKLIEESGNNVEVALDTLTFGRRVSARNGMSVVAANFHAGDVALYPVDVEFVATPVVQEKKALCARDAADQSI
ncbi:MAG: hypothetical protein NC924_00370 [Candidatus Omnitrophica bacterium]|nr:hypothetical protein [Candidatus Omnitrophota bacterium]